MNYRLLFLVPALSALLLTAGCSDGDSDETDNALHGVTLCIVSDRSDGRIIFRQNSENHLTPDTLTLNIEVTPQDFIPMLKAGVDGSLADGYRCYALIQEDSAATGGNSHNLMIEPLGAATVSDKAPNCLVFQFLIGTDAGQYLSALRSRLSFTVEQPASAHLVRSPYVTVKVVKNTGDVPTNSELKNLLILDVSQYSQFAANSADYTSQSFAAFSAALSQAMEALNEEDHTASEYEALRTALREAFGNLELKPWVPITDFIPNSSMLIIMDENSIPVTSVSDNDRFGAFVGSKCVGVATPSLQPNGKTYFFLQVLQDNADAGNDALKIQLKYYSAERKTIYSSREMDYKDQEILGSYNAPYGKTELGWVY